MINIRQQSGVGLVEIMVAMLIALFLLIGLGTLFITTRLTFGAQQNLSNLQDSERMAMTMLSNIIQTAGYFPDPITSTAALSLPVTGNYAAAGQPVTGTTGGSATTPDTLQARFVTVAGDGIEDCNGGSPGGTRNNVFSINVATDTLQCAVNGANPQPLVSGVRNMKVLYGVDTLGSPTNPSVTAYLPANLITAANWSNVKSVRIDLTFVNPLAGQPGQPALLPVTFTHTARVMNRL